MASVYTFYLPPRSSFLFVGGKRALQKHQLHHRIVRRLRSLILDTMEVGEGDRLLYKGLPDKVKMNQLQNLLHDALISTEHVEHCCIIRRKDVSLRASSVGFTLYQDQIQMFVDAFKNPPQTREDGLYFEDRHYKCVRADKNAVYAKCVKRGLVVVRTGSLLIVGTYNDNMYPSVCVEAVEKLADYFKEKGK
ncbi:profilin-4-like isoform X1 [Branchiostoma floridae]|uniref:Profilin n=1 Tax=Branchiostoma floridae TaxID=7739 RepID=A0A9J7LQP2_BRAFL|nr:profilin-4-like isoform X1 [Branchiostoma floridae]